VDRRTGTTKNWRTKSASYWREECRRCSMAGTSIKVAELGGKPETPFEQAFSNLAHSYISEKAPKLLEYEVGFQIIERSDDATRAVGVFGFKVGNQWLYCPVFFLNGDLKGHELLYLKSQDMFVPLKDNWISYLLGRKQNLLGKAVDRNLSQLGVLAPNLYQLSRSPYKVASAQRSDIELPQWTIEFLPTLAKMVLTKVAFQEDMFLKVLKEAGSDGASFMSKMASEYPTIYRATMQFYGQDRMTKLVGELENDRKRLQSNSLLQKLASESTTVKVVSDGIPQEGDLPFKSKPNSKSEPKVEVLTRADVFGDKRKDAPWVGDPERKTLLTEEHIVKDQRRDNETSLAYRTTSTVRLFSPGETGLYEVLVKPDKFEKCLIVTSPYSGNGKQPYCLVIPIEGEKTCLKIHPAKVLCQSQYTNKEWEAWIDSLPDVGDNPSTENNDYSDTMIFLGRKGQGTVPLSLTSRYDGSSSGPSYSVHFSDYCSEDNRNISYSKNKASEGSIDRCVHDDIAKSIGCQEKANARLVRLTPSGSQFRLTYDELYVPQTFKRLKIAYENKPPIEPGNLSDVAAAINHGMPTLDIVGTKAGFVMNQRTFGKQAAFKHLVIDWNLRAAAAEVILAEAEASQHQKQSYWIKRAGPFLTEGGGPSAPSPYEFPNDVDSDMGSHLPAQLQHTYSQPVESMQPNSGNRDLYRPIGPDADTMNTASRAAQTGQKEVFDTAMIGSMLRTVRQESMIDRYIGPLMKGMDSLGRIYLQYLWHGQEFEDRFGASELPELEDGIRNTFEGTGDLVLKLRQKGVEPFAADGTDVDLGGIANQ
jgi:hypothetical protein